MKIVHSFFITIFLSLGLFSSAQQSRHIVLISIDGLRPEMYLDSTWPTPNLQVLMRQGTYAQYMKSVFPSYTYPSHTAMLTGALPARSGIFYNQPKGSTGDWNWFANAIRVPTLWQVLKAKGFSTAAVEWPVSVTNEITYNIPEIWSPKSPEDRITETRKYATPGLVEEVERFATGKLDSNSMNEEYLSLDENSARAASYVFQKYKPALLALHFACVDGAEHKFGREGDSVRLAVGSADRAIGDIMETIERCGLKDSTTILIVGDHGFSTINTVFRPNLLLLDVPAKFQSAGGSAFLYLQQSKSLTTLNTESIIKEVRRRLDSLSVHERKMFRILDRVELDRMGADSAAILALAATPGLVFSGVSTFPKPLSLFSSVKGGHHGYDPNLPDMHTGFIAVGAGIRTHNKIQALCVTDIAPLIAQLLKLDFVCPDGILVPGILQDLNTK